MLLIIIWYYFHNYFWPRPWPQPPEIGLDLGLEDLASFNITACYLLHQLPRSLQTSRRFLDVKTVSARSLCC